MCGIAGLLGDGIRRDAEERLERLTLALAHRGPDGAGHRWFGDSVGLGHRRLSIVDLARGAQPMSNEDGRVWVILNGELYNHSAIRRELQHLGHEFRTQSDTEVLVHGWEEWGPDVLARLNGIYAFGLYDGRRGTGDVWLARDPLGVKPVYVGRQGGLWWFASELAAARRAGLVNADLRRDAIAQYLVYRFIPSPATPYHNVWKVPAGHFVHFPLDALPTEPAFRSFPTRFEPASLPRTESEWTEALRDGLRAAVKQQLMSDVPVGTLLSGGMDSTVVTRIMCDELRHPPCAFAIGFEGTGPLDELPPARRAAAALGVPLVEVQVREAEYLKAWSEQVAGLGEPIANPGIVLVGLLCRQVKKTHKVVLSGQGADEPLGGYPRHIAARFAGLLRFAQPVLEVLPERFARSDRVRRMQRAGRARDEAHQFAEMLAVFAPQEAAVLSKGAASTEELVAPAKGTASSGRNHDFLNRLLAVDARLSLADDLLLVADHMAMASSVELRVPFLDLEFFTLVQLMPSRYKVSSFGARKALYRRAAAPLIPTSLRGSLAGWQGKWGRKLGFSTPLDGWVRKWAATEAEGFLLGPDAHSPAYLSVDAIRALLDDVRRGRPRGRQILSLYVLEHWLREAVA